MEIEEQLTNSEEQPSFRDTLTEFQAQLLDHFTTYFHGCPVCLVTFEERIAEGKLFDEFACGHHACPECVDQFCENLVDKSKKHFRCFICRENTYIKTPVEENRYMAAFFPQIEFESGYEDTLVMRNLLILDRDKQPKDIENQIMRYCAQRDALRSIKRATETNQRQANARRARAQERRERFVNLEFTVEPHEISAEPIQPSEYPGVPRTPRVVTRHRVYAPVDSATGNFFFYDSEEETIQYMPSNNRRQLPDSSDDEGAQNTQPSTLELEIELEELSDSDFSDDGSEMSTGYNSHEDLTSSSDSDDSIQEIELQTTVEFQ